MSPPNRSGWHQIPLAFFDTGIDSDQCLVSGNVICSCRGHYRRTLDDISKRKIKYNTYDTDWNSGHSNDRCARALYGVLLSWKITAV